MRHVLKRAGTHTVAGVAAVAVIAAVVVCDGVRTGIDRWAAVDIRVTPDNGARVAAVGGRVRVSVRRGRLEQVTVRRAGQPEREDVPGRISQDGRTWTPMSGALVSPSAAYRVDAVAVDGEGRRSARRTTFTTLAPHHRFTGRLAPEPRSPTVGTGMIVSIVFDHRIRDRAAVERAVSVTAVPAVPVAGHWFGDRRLDLRPEAFWRPGTRVAVHLNLHDVRASPGVYGLGDRTVHFTVGRSRTAVVDASRHLMSISENGVEVATLPVTAGAPRTPTYNGTMVVEELDKVTRMDGRTVGFGSAYDIHDVPHALRLTTSGTFLHGNYWADPGVFGQTNTSHGCIGLRDAKGGSPSAPAGWFFDRALVGDVVQVVGSPDRTVAPDNGLSGWNMPWGTWQAGSALYRGPVAAAGAPPTRA